MSPQEMTAEKLYETLKKIQEPKGNYFNKDLENMTMPLLESLLENKKTYGYMVCPCRIASGEYEQDRDIICPCAYREPDMKEYGACFCGLYVTEEWNAAPEEEHEYVPERRPPEKLAF